MQREQYEADFLRLVQLLEIKPAAFDSFMQFAAEAHPTMAADKDLETKKAEAIALCQRRIQAAIDLYGDGRISRAEYARRIERNEREIASWQARTNESEKLGMELT